MAAPGPLPPHTGSGPGALQPTVAAVQISRADVLLESFTKELATMLFACGDQPTSLVSPLPPTLPLTRHLITLYIKALATEAFRLSSVPDETHVCAVLRERGDTFALAATSEAVKAHASIRHALVLELGGDAERLNALQTKAAWPPLHPARMLVEDRQRFDLRCISGHIRHSGAVPPAGPPGPAVPSSGPFATTHQQAGQIGGGTSTPGAGGHIAGRGQTHVSSSGHPASSGGGGGVGHAPSNSHAQAVVQQGHSSHTHPAAPGPGHGGHGRGGGVPVGRVSVGHGGAVGLGAAGSAPRHMPPAPVSTFGSGGSGGGSVAHRPPPHAATAYSAHTAASGGSAARLGAMPGYTQDTIRYAQPHAGGAHAPMRSGGSIGASGNNFGMSKSYSAAAPATYALPLHPTHTSGGAPLASGMSAPVSVPVDARSIQTALMDAAAQRLSH